MTTAELMNELCKRVKSRYENIPTYDAQPWDLFLRFATPEEIEQLGELRLKYQDEFRRNNAGAKQRVLDRLANRRKVNG